MSLEPTPSDADNGYCEPRDVLAYFDRLESVDATSVVTERQVNRAIQAKSDKIDKKTGHAWRERRMVDVMHDIDGPYRYGSGRPISLQRRDIRTPLDATEGDKIEVYSGGSGSDDYIDLVAESGYQEGRTEDYWVEESTGTLHIYRRGSYFNNYRQVRVTYRFGKETVPAEITEICAKLVAADLMETDFYRYVQPGNEEAPDAANMAERFREQAMQDLHYYEEVRSTGIN